MRSGQTQCGVSLHTIFLLVAVATLSVGAEANGAASSKSPAFQPSRISPFISLIKTKREWLALTHPSGSQDTGKVVLVLYSSPTRCTPGLCEEVTKAVVEAAGYFQSMHTFKRLAIAYVEDVDDLDQKWLDTYHGHKARSDFVMLPWLVLYAPHTSGGFEVFHGPFDRSSLIDYVGDHLVKMIAYHEKATTLEEL